MGVKGGKAFIHATMADALSVSPSQEDMAGRLNSFGLYNDPSNTLDDMYFKLVPSIDENELPSLRKLVNYLSQPENFETGSTKICDTPDETSDNNQQEITQGQFSERILEESNSFLSDNGLVCRASTNTESDSNLFDEMVAGLLNLYEDLDLSTNLESPAGSSIPSLHQEVKNEADLTKEETNCLEGLKPVNDYKMTNSNQFSSTNTQLIKSSSVTTNSESQKFNEWHGSINQLKLGSPNLQNTEPFPMLGSTKAQHQNNPTLLQLNDNEQKQNQTTYIQPEQFQNGTPLINSETTADQRERDISDGNKWDYYCNQLNESSQPICINQSTIFQHMSPFSTQNLNMQHYFPVNSEEEKKGKAMVDFKQSLEPAKESLKIFPHQQHQLDVPMDGWQEFNPLNQFGKNKESTRPFSITTCHLEDFDKFHDLSHSQFRELCRFETPLGPSQKLNVGNSSPVLGGNQIFYVYNNTTHRDCSNANSSSQSFESKRDLSREEMLHNRRSVIKRNISVCGETSENCSSSTSYTELCEGNDQPPLKLMKMSQDHLGFERGLNAAHNQFNFTPTEKVKCEVLDFSSTACSLPSTSTSYIPPSVNIVETPLMREHRRVRSQLGELLEGIDSVILQKGVKEKFSRNEELAEDDIHDEKKLKKSLETLSSYFKEAWDLYAKHQRGELSKEELSREAKRLKNKFSGMKSRVKKKKEFICEKKEFFHLVHEFKRMRSFSDDLENFQNLVVRELDHFNMSQPLGKFFLNTVFSQMQTSIIDPWIEEVYSDSIKKLENF